MDFRCRKSSSTTLIRQEHSVGFVGSEFLTYVYPTVVLALHNSSVLVVIEKVDIVDAFWLNIFPVTLDVGKRLFDKGG